MKVSSLTLFLLVASFYSADVFAGPHNYEEIDRRIDGWKNKYKAKITNLPPENLQDKFNLADIGKYGDLLENDWRKIISESKERVKETDQILVLISKLTEAGMLTELESEKLIIKIKDDYLEMSKRYQQENAKYILLRKRLIKNHSITEFAEYLKSLKLPQSCKIEDIKEQEGILTISVSREEDGKIIRQQGTLNFKDIKNLVAYSVHDPDHGEIKTHFQDIDFDAQTEQSKIKVYQYPNGAVSLFSFQSFNKKEYLAKIPIIGINIFERKSDPFINCSTNEHSRDLDMSNNTARGAIKESSAFDNTGRPSSKDNQR